MSRFLSLIAIASFGALLSTPAMAQEMPEHGVFIMNSLLFLFGVAKHTTFSNFM